MNAREMPAEMADRHGVPAAEALEGLPIAAPHRLEGARLGATTATTLRAALDLLLGESVPRRPLDVRWDDGALEVRCPLLQPEAVALAAGLMETIEGSLAPPAAGQREWVLRAPIRGPQSMYLMLRQGTLAVALPWHSVLRVRMAKPEDIAQLARREGSTVLPPFVSVPLKPEPRPAVLLGLGLKRAYLLADRLIWRLPAARIDQPTAETGVAIGHAVRTVDGEIYWAIDVTELMAGIEPAPLPKGFTFAEPEPARVPPTPPKPAPPPPLSFETALSRKLQSEPPLRRLEPGEVEPLGSPPPAPVPIQSVPKSAPKAAPTPAPPKPAPPPVPSAPVPSPPVKRREPRALIAEDSIVGRIFLERLLARRGFAVTSVGTAAELESELRAGTWDVVMADVDLPDAGRAEHLRLADTRWVALVRDRDDERLAEEAGVPLTLRKPFESDHLDRLLPKLGLEGFFS